MYEENSDLLMITCDTDIMSKKINTVSSQVHTENVLYNTEGTVEYAQTVEIMHF